jgi:predicted metalloprotease with PDZ domain
MRKNLLGCLLLCLNCIYADNGYRYTVDLTRVVNDKVRVNLYPPAIDGSEIEFMFPAMVPGTYEVYDFGRFVSNLTAKAKDGTQLKVTRVNVNTYRISQANSLDLISYEVDDTFDKTDLPNTKTKIVFEPGGTNFEADKNFSINTHSMFGYFKGMTGFPFTLEFEKPAGFYPSTGLSELTLGVNKDIIKANGYHELVDSPIMYCRPDTTTIMVSNAKVLVSTYSPNRLVTSGFIAATLKELLHAQKEYLGGELPVEKYAFLFYFLDKQRSTLSGASGALEHSYSSFYVLPEFDSLALQQQIRDVAAHEFFHIVTPLNIHSKEIGEFDFNNPRMSAHLWLYEGMTEYAAHHAQVKAGIIDINEFMNTMMGKYENSVENYNDTMSFTWMSKNVLNEKVHKQYANVYEKGAVISMCLDILLRDLSDGAYGTQNLMKDLAGKYGKDSSFNDDELFKDIEQFTYPEVGTFLRDHVGGKKPLPVEDIFQRVGIQFNKEVTVEEFSLGNPDLDYNARTNRLYITGTRDMDAFGKNLGYKKGDELVKLNGEEIHVENLRETIENYYAGLKEGEMVTIDVMRPKKLNKKKYKPVVLTAKAEKIKRVRRNQVSVVENMTEKQKQTIKAWIGL